MIQAGRRPHVSAKLLTMAGAIPWMSMYVVIERLISVGVMWYFATRIGITGKYIWPEMLHKTIPTVVMQTIIHLVGRPNAEYGVSLASGVSLFVVIGEDIACKSAVSAF